MVSCRPIFLIIGLLLAISSHGQDTYKYIVYFADKANSLYSLDEPTAYLSDDAIERRQKYDIPVNEQDLPVVGSYVEAVESMGFEVLHESRWMNAVLISSETALIPAELADEEYVDRVVWASLEVAGGRQELWLSETSDIQTGDYGAAWNQISMVNGQFLHQNGYSGSGMRIAVLDAGFWKADELEAFAAMRTEDRLAAAYDFVDDDGTVFESSGHGTHVLSTMAAKLDGQYKGTAPEADYILIKTEDVRTEQLVEEFNYVLGLEFADQAGAHVVNTSLGYTRYDHAEMDNEWESLDGEVPIASRGADIAASKGMLIINSAGNEGNSAWQYTSIPADGDSVLAIGSVNADRLYSTFSGKGWIGDERIKPDLLAQGEGTAIISSGGEILYANGTSYSAPLIAGLAACLWQAFPSRTNMEIADAVRQSASQYLSPDRVSGYGIPDFQAAYALLYEKDIEAVSGSGIRIFPNPFSRNITIMLDDIPDQDMTFTLVNDIGQVLGREFVSSGSRKTVNLYFDEVNGLNKGLYFLKVRTDSGVDVFKLIKV